MKKVLLLFVLIFTLSSCGYSKTDMAQAKVEAWREGYEEGYDLAKYESKGDIEHIRSQFDQEIEGLKEEYSYYMDNAYDAGYEDGYDDCLEEHGLVEEYSYDPANPPRIKKDK